MSFDRKIRRQRQQETERAIERKRKIMQLREQREMKQVDLEDVPMPYQNVPDPLQTKMHDCVKKVMATGKDEQAAIAICYSSVVDNASPEDIKNKFNFEFPVSGLSELQPVQRGELIELAIGDVKSETITIQVLRAGTFIDMHGREVQIDSAELAKVVENSNAELRTRELPVDLGHPTDPAAPAAAWYKRFFKQFINGVEWICAEVELSALGAKSLADKLYKYFSASIDIENASIIGGGFVNRPAVSGQQPVGSLSQYLQMKPIKGGESQMDEKEMESKLAQARADERQKAEAQLAEMESKLAQARIDERNRVLAEQARVSEINTLAAELTAGPKALWHKPVDLAEWLGKLTDDDRKLVGELLREIKTRGLVDLSEMGSAKENLAKKELPKAYKSLLGKWIEAGNKVDAFFSINPEVGKAEEFDLSEFIK